MGKFVAVLLLMVSAAPATAESFEQMRTREAAENRLRNIEHTLRDLEYKQQALERKQRELEDRLSNLQPARPARVPTAKEKERNSRVESEIAACKAAITERDPGRHALASMECTTRALRND